MNIWFSHSTDNWMPARDYQRHAYLGAMAFFANTSRINRVYQYHDQKNNIIFQLLQNPSDPLMLLMIRPNNTVAYLRGDTHIRMIAPYDINVPYAGGIVHIPQHATYYCRYNDPTPIIGWHGTYNPPCDMDGMPVV